ncbi:hypothetical protein SI859A1_03200 [Aurantimonas manganoxydans SI85-9A1]|uniref:Uncharacterized protein n=1 Tax=Aurantimonas manganoxydans (strain ATCC BAA-1229 / DSM 21871 / SI85-9A1) TaxID=287752 RepID=Q1YFI1_AURMS|nr:hypothetical protein SI859A1_03200 [Aurantimonas manganoxydans SI85-9A1]
MRRASMKPARAASVPSAIRIEPLPASRAIASSTKAVSSTVATTVWAWPACSRPGKPEKLTVTRPALAQRNVSPVKHDPAVKPATAPSLRQDWPRAGAVAASSSAAPAHRARALRREGMKRSVTAVLHPVEGGGHAAR